MKLKLLSKSPVLLVFPIIFAFLACQKNQEELKTVASSTLQGVPALKLNFRFENDVPAPAADPAKPVQPEEKSNALQADFDQNRPEETLERTIFSPDKKRILAVYQKADDSQGNYRLDMYSAEGALIKKITPNGLAVNFPDTIVWSPDSNNLAFMGVIRLNQINAAPTPTPDAPTPPSLDNDNTNSNANGNTAEPIETNANTTSPVDQNGQVLTFRTQQIYICNADGGDLKPLTQNEGFIYFYFVWSPDSSALISLVATWKEWQFMQYQADQKGEFFVPFGRPRLVEKSGRIRLLDDNLTSVRPVWSPDSTKIASSFDKEVRIYDAVGDSPTQAAIPLRNQLLISSQKYDDDAKQKEASNTNANSNSNTKANTNINTNINSALPKDVNTLPDENTLISFLPIIQLEWTEDKMLYLQTGFVKEFKNSAENTRSNLRWHRLLLSPQAIRLN